METSCQCFIDYIPQDLLIEIFTFVASRPEKPLNDLKNLRLCCKSFYQTSNSQRVGETICVDDETRYWLPNKEEYLDFLRHCAKSGNLRANFMLGLEEIVGLGINSGIQHLITAANGGHLLAGYAAGIILYKSEATRDDGMRLLNMVAEGKVDNSSKMLESKRSGSAIINQCREVVAKSIRNISWSTRKWTVPKKWHCHNYLCGRKAADARQNEWLGENGLQRNFCSQQCRWNFEFYLFSELV